MILRIWIKILIGNSFLVILQISILILKVTLIGKLMILLNLGIIRIYLLILILKLRIILLIIYLLIIFEHITR